MNGYIGVFNYPFIDLMINGLKASCLIDTGFTGDVAVGLDQLAAINLIPVGQRHFSKTAGGHVRTRSINTNIEWFNNQRNVTLTIFDEPRLGPKEAIIGVHLLIGYIMVIDLNEGVVSIKDPSLRGGF